MSLIYTRNCVICSSPDIVITGGHVIRRSTYVVSNEPNKDIIIVASLCEKHQHAKSIKDGYFGEYEKWMGMCDNPFKKDEKKLDFAEITCRLLDHLASDNEENYQQTAKLLGISVEEYDEYLTYAKVEKITDVREKHRGCDATID